MREYEILLVDDDQLILKTQSVILREKGFNVTTAQNGMIAIELIKKRHFDLIITDLVMGEIDGIQVLKKAKAINSDIIVIILTGYGDMKSAIDALRLKAADYLLKPCEAEEILFRVNQAIEKMELSQKIKIYEKLLPVCCKCKNIRDDSGKEPGKGVWLSLEEYLNQRVRINVTHGLCPSCAQKLGIKFEEE
ncbi:response regulator [candidate division KSB1 bacterium]|nr:response regulator [candidate division KSB1 bacterium]